MDIKTELLFLLLKLTIINDLFCTLLFHVPNLVHPNPKAADKS